jgi:hypothetical protein
MRCCLTLDIQSHQRGAPTDTVRTRILESQRYQILNELWIGTRYISFRQSVFPTHNIGVIRLAILTP